MCKLLVALLLAHHFFSKLDDPFLPFIKPLDFFNTIPGVFKYAVRSVFSLATIMLFFNIRVRTSCVIIGLLIIVQQLASIPEFSNHTFICGCFLFLSGLTRKEDAPMLLYWQISIIYFGAFLNKVIDPDWLNGVFMDNWMLNTRGNKLYISATNSFPGMWLALFLSYAAMLSELVIGIIVLIKRFRPYTLWVMLIFHTLLFSFTGLRFGHFYENILIIILVFMAWPKHVTHVTFSEPKTYLARLHRFFDWDNKFNWTMVSNKSSYWLNVQLESGISLSNFNAVRFILTRTASFFVILFCFDALSHLVFKANLGLRFIVTQIVVWSLILFFIPMIKWKPLKKDDN